MTGPVVDKVSTRSYILLVDMMVYRFDRRFF